MGSSSKIRTNFESSSVSNISVHDIERALSRSSREVQPINYAPPQTNSSAVNLQNLTDPTRDVMGSNPFTQDQKAFP